MTKIDRMHQKALSPDLWYPFQLPGTFIRADTIIHNHMWHEPKCCSAPSLEGEMGLAWPLQPLPAGLLMERFTRWGGPGPYSHLMTPSQCPPPTSVENPPTHNPPSPQVPQPSINPKHPKPLKAPLVFFPGRIGLWLR